MPGSDLEMPQGGEGDSVAALLASPILEEKPGPPKAITWTLREDRRDAVRTSEGLTHQGSQRALQRLPADLGRVQKGADISGRVAGA